MSSGARLQTVSLSRRERRGGVSRSSPVLSELSTAAASRGMRRRRRRGEAAAAVDATASSSSKSSSSSSTTSCLVCSSAVAENVNDMVAEVAEAASRGAQAVELRLDYLMAGGGEKEEEVLVKLESIVRDAVPALVCACERAGVVSIATLRPTWEGGQFETGVRGGDTSGDHDDDAREHARVSALRRIAEECDVDYIDCEMLAAEQLFGGGGEWQCPSDTGLILSRHDYERTPSQSVLRTWQTEMFDMGADVAKLACHAESITDCARMLALLDGDGSALQEDTSDEGDVRPSSSSGVPSSIKPRRTIALSMGEVGVVTRLLAPKFTGFLSFGALDEARASAPGQPTLASMQTLYRMAAQNPGTRAYGIIGNPVAHSKSPLLHNTAFAHVGLDAVYVPLLVHDLPAFLDAFPAVFTGFSVTIPHKEVALSVCDEIDPVAAEIGAVNTIVRRPIDGRLVGYNTDWSAAIGAIQRALTAGKGKESSALEGKTVVIIGAGGAGRALAFGASRRAGARVIVANRSFERAQLLAEAVGGQAVEMDDIISGRVGGDVLVNTTSVGMHPHEDETPVPREHLAAYSLVFDAVYNPMETRLLREAADAGCITVNGVEMFVGQAMEQFELFTGHPSPGEIMRQTVVANLTSSK